MKEQQEFEAQEAMQQQLLSLWEEQERLLAEKSVEVVLPIETVQAPVIPITTSTTPPKTNTAFADALLKQQADLLAKQKADALLKQQAAQQAADVLAQKIADQKAAAAKAAAAKVATQKATRKSRAS